MPGTPGLRTRSCLISQPLSCRYCSVERSLVVNLPSRKAGFLLPSSVPSALRASSAPELVPSGGHPKM